jgi:solute carrier family 25 (mitochondrial carnitine/acylcarnitine transporter), member 20/29
MNKEKGNEMTIPIEESRSRHGFWKSFVSGGIGGTCLVLVGHPLDLIKVKLQTEAKGSTIVGTFKRIIATDGFRGLYRGMSGPLMGVTPMLAVCFWSYDIGQQLVKKLWSIKEDEKLDLKEISLAGGFSALPTTLVTTPFERLKIVLQTQTLDTFKYKGPVDIIRKILAKEGIRGIKTFYQGTIATVARDFPGSMAYFATYEGMKNRLTKMYRVNESDSNKIPILAILLSGGFAGMANWTVATPADVIKTRIQAGSSQTGIQIMFQLIRTEGVLSLFRGLGPSLLRAFPANAACYGSRGIT